jgi:membrane-associated phospholipid phosphatase
MIRGAHAVMLLAAVAGPARADEPTDDDRLVHAAVAGGMGVTYAILQVGFGNDLSPTSCRWCVPDGFDVSVRDALKSGDTGTAATISNITLGLTPVAALGMTALGGRGHGWRRQYDDGIAIVESGLVTLLIQHATKLTVARQRPYAHFAPPGTLAPSIEDNVSFFSGHTSFTFSFAVSAGVVTSRRGYAIAPYVWATGLTLAATTGYLRIAADRHYATDVITGAAVGSLVGYAWPTLVHPHIQRDIDVVPTGQGLAIFGTF